jgi:hypothetical protein
VNTNLDDNFPVLKKLRKLVVEDIEKNTMQKGFEDTICELQDWLSELDNKIASFEKKKIMLHLN